MSNPHFELWGIHVGLADGSRSALICCQADSLESAVREIEKAGCVLDLADKRRPV